MENVGSKIMCFNQVGAQERQNDPRYSSVCLASKSNDFVVCVFHTGASKAMCFTRVEFLKQRVLRRLEIATMYSFVRF